MDYLVFKGDDIQSVEHDIVEAKKRAKSLLPKDYKKGDRIRPSLRTAVYKHIIEYGG